MPSLSTSPRIAAVLVLLGATGAALAGPAITRSDEGSLRCELDVSSRNGTLELSALAHAGKATRGEYAFRVSGRGTDIRQGAPFALSAGKSERLGTVTLGGRASDYDVDLTVLVEGKTIHCGDAGGRRT